MGMMRDVLRLARDFHHFGFANAVRSCFARTGAGTICLQLPKHGPVIIRRGDSDLDVVRQVFQDQEYFVTSGGMAQRLQARYQEILAAGDVPVIVDAGANIGAASIWFASLFPEAAICAVEPDHDNVEILRRNVAGNRRVTVVEAAIGGTEGFVAVKKGGEEGSWAVQTERSDGGCPIVTINQVIAKFPRGVPLIVKIDIEGFEEDVFSGNLEWLDSTYSLFIEPHDWMLPGRYTSRTFQKAMGIRDFEILLRGENLIYVRA